jgi:hypothetical protein
MVYWRGRWFVSSVSEVRIIWNITAWHPITFLSKALNLVEQNYEIYDTKMLAIIQGLEEWRHYLEGARHPVEILTDHKNLEYFRVAQKLNRRQARWMLYLSISISLRLYTSPQARPKHG